MGEHKKFLPERGPVDREPPDDLALFENAASLQVAGGLPQAPNQTFRRDVGERLTAIVVAGPPSQFTPDLKLICEYLK
jgi:hypothetical protein